MEYILTVFLVEFIIKVSVYHGCYPFCVCWTTVYNQGKQGKIFLEKGLTLMKYNCYACDRQTTNKSAFFSVQTNMEKVCIGTILSKYRWNSVFFAYYPSLSLEIGCDNSG